MIYLKPIFIKLTLFFGALLGLQAPASWGSCPEELDHDFRRLHSDQEINLCAYGHAQALLVVNTASHCGFTYQFGGLESLHQEYAERGLVVVGFPSDDFNQEAKQESKTAEVCYINYGVTFDMTSPIAVRGDTAHPLFKMLAGKTRGPSWNFNKYLVDPKDMTVTHFGSRVAPDSPELKSAVESLL